MNFWELKTWWQKWETKMVWMRKLENSKKVDQIMEIENKKTDKKITMI